MATIASTQLIDVVFQTLRNQVESMTPQEQLDWSERVLSVSLTPVASSPASSSVVDEDYALVPNDSNVTKVSRRKARIAATRTNRGKKAVNAFMTFRAYISPVLGKIPQKSRSPMLSLMWRSEKRQSQFHLLGAAFSKIRDQCSDCPSLEKFLEVAVGVVSIIPADKYFELTGWVVVDDGEKKSLRSINRDDKDVIATYPLQTNASVYDIIQHCFDEGLISAMPRAETRSSSDTQPQPLMSFAALPQNQDLIDNLSSRATPTSASQNLEDPFAFFDFSDPASSTGYSPSFQDITRDQQQTYETTPAVAHWDPEINPPILGIDPNVIQG